MSKIGLVIGRGTGCFRSGVISALKQDSRRAGIRSERSHGWRSERSEGNMPFSCQDTLKYETSFYKP